MKVWGITEEEARQCASKVGIAIFNDWRGSGIDTVGRALQFRLGLGDDKMLYRRLSAMRWNDRPPRKVNAVCWHGHRDFMREVFKINPDARIKSAVADYRGSDDFERTFPGTGHRNIDSQMYPTEMQDACVCEEDDCTSDSFQPTSSSGGITVYEMSQTMIRGCDHFIFSPEHYRSDGSCRCDDVGDPNMAEWGYAWDTDTGRWI